MNMLSLFGGMIMAASVIAIVVGNMPIIDTLLGGAIGDTMQYYNQNFYWIFAAGAFLFYFPLSTPHIAGLIAVIIAVVLFILTHFGSWFGL